MYVTLGWSRRLLELVTQQVSAERVLALEKLYMNMEYGVARSELSGNVVPALLAWLRSHLNS